MYVFTEPAGGWSGQLDQTAELTGSDVPGQLGLLPVNNGFGSTVAVSGSTIVTALPVGGADDPGAAYVYTEPAGGWANATQTAELRATNGIIVAGSPFGTAPSGALAQVAVSGSTIVVPGSLGTTAEHPVEFVFIEPAGGWSGTESQAATLVASDGGTLATPYRFGQEIVAGAVSGVSPHSRPARDRTGERGLANVGPRSAGRAARRAVRQTVRLSLGWRGLVETRSLLAKVRRLAKRHGTALRLTTIVTVTDAAGHATRLRVRVTWRAPRRS